MPDRQHQSERGGSPLNTGGDEIEANIRSIADSLGVALEESQVRQVAAYFELLLRWNRVYNLTAVRDLQAMLQLHLADCLAVVPPLLRECVAGRARLLDVGSGAGLPGVLLAIAIPDLRVVCVDTVAKKASFIRQVAGELDLTARLQARHRRVEAMEGESFDVITSRAFSSLADFVVLTQHLLAPQGVWLALKGKVPKDEIASLPPAIEVFHVEQLSIPGQDVERCLVWMRRRAGSSA